MRNRRGKGLHGPQHPVYNGDGRISRPAPFGVGALGGAVVASDGEFSGAEERPARSPGLRFGTGLTIGGLLGLTGGLLFGWWSAGGPLPSFSGSMFGPPAERHAAAASTEAAAAPVPDINQNQAALRAAIKRGDGITIGVFGDSMADGLWAGLYRQFRDVEGVKVVRFSRPSTGLSRYDYVNVETQTVEQLSRQRVDIAVFMIGTNDRQAMQGDGKVLTFSEAPWRQAYGERVDALVGHARQSGAAVYWMGLPRMRSDRAEAGAELVNDIFAARATALGFPFIDSTAATSDAKRQYAAYLPIGAGGKPQLVRASDGIHMTMGGYLLLSKPMAEQIKADLGEARAAVAPPPPAAPLPAPTDQAKALEPARAPASGTGR